jgi:3'(2'), 5'-bisphosphate nucleotidase
MQEITLNNYPSPYIIALQAAVAASDVLMDFYARDFSTSYKADESPVTEADIASSNIIDSFLEKTNIPILGEEMVNQPYSERILWEQNWCIDPLDGTKEFIKKNGEFVVNIALIRKNKPIFGIIASPILRKLLVGDSVYGVYFVDFDALNYVDKWEKVEAKPNIVEPFTVATSRSYHDSMLQEFSAKLQERYGKVEFLKKGSALKFFDLAAGNVAVYPRFAPTMEWDIAAGQAILEALGGEICDATTNKSLVYNKEDLRNPHFIAKTNAFLKV